MTVVDNNSLVKPNFFFHIYTTHALRVIQDCVATDKKDKIRRTKIENDIIRLTLENEDLPLSHKVSCTSLILHTDTFETFWLDQGLNYDLSDKSLERVKPEYHLISDIELPNSEPETVTDKIDGPRRKGANKNQKLNKAASTPVSQGKNQKNNKNNSGRKPATPSNKGAKAAAMKVTKTKTARTPRSKPTALKIDAIAELNAMVEMEKDVLPEADVTVDSPQSQSQSQSQSQNQSQNRGRKTAREAYLEHMERTRDEPSPQGGPTSSESEGESDEGVC